MMAEISKWEKLGISKELANNLISKGFEVPSDIQNYVLNVMKQNKWEDFTLVAQAKNGSGKTLSFVVPAIQIVDPKLPVYDQVGDKNLPSPQVLIFCHSNELASQTEDDVIKKVLGNNIPISVTGFRKAEKKSVWEGAHIGVATYGVEFHRRISLRNLKMIVMDEYDDGIKDEKTTAKMENLVKEKILEANKTIFLLISATYDQALIEKLGLPSKNGFRAKTLHFNDLALEAVGQYYIEVKEETKYESFFQVLEQVITNQTIIFVTKKEECTELRDRLAEKFLISKMIHGGMSLDEREESWREFKEGKFNILITTNLLARGIDWRRMLLVINFRLPYKGDMKSRELDKETYIHRIGRTGRFGDFGVALNFVFDKNDLESIEKLKAHYNMDIKKLENMKELLIHANAALEKRANLSKSAYFTKFIAEASLKETIKAYYDKTINQKKGKKIIFCCETENTLKKIIESLVSINVQPVASVNVMKYDESLYAHHIYFKENKSPVLVCNIVLGLSIDLAEIDLILIVGEDIDNPFETIKSFKYYFPRNTKILSVFIEKEKEDGQINLMKIIKGQIGSEPIDIDKTEDLPEFLK